MFVRISNAYELQRSELGVRICIMGLSNDACVCELYSRSEMGVIRISNDACECEL